MLLQPKNRKFRKFRKGRLKFKVSSHAANQRSIASRFSLKYGDYGLITLEGARFTARQIEAGRRTITRSLRRTGRLWIRSFPDLPVSSKPTDARMGKGKGAVDYWICPLKPGQILFEIAGVEKEAAYKALEGAAKKFPFPTKAVSRMGALDDSYY